MTLASALLMASISVPADSMSKTTRINGALHRPMVLGIDTALPLVTTPVANTCLVRSTNTSGQLVTGIGITTQIFGWAFATLFVAGFTGAVRKT